MAKRKTINGLFGQHIPQERQRYEAGLERLDKDTLEARAARVRWLSTVIPMDKGFVMPMESFFVFDEAKSSFVYGNYVAAVVLAAAFIEHWFSIHLANRGYEKEAAQGLASSVRCARDNGLTESTILDSTDRIRLIRNPFVHLKSFEHEHSVGQRVFKHKIRPEALLEKDAKDALRTMYTVAYHAFRDT